MQPIKVKRKKPGPKPKHYDLDDEEDMEYEEYVRNRPARSPSQQGRRPSPRRHGGRVSRPGPGFGWLLVGLAILAVLFGYLWGNDLQQPAGSYRVTGVGQGKVYAVDPKGRAVAFSDPQLVRLALAGKLKAGDPIQK